MILISLFAIFNDCQILLKHNHLKIYKWHLRKYFSERRNVSDMSHERRVDGRNSNIIYLIIFTSTVTNSMESNAHEIIEYKPKKYSQFIFFVGNQKNIFLSLYVYIFSL